MHCFVELYKEGKWHYLRNEYLFCENAYIYAPLFLNVRNYMAMPYISKPRGLPNDITPEILAEVNSLIEPHGLSWLGCVDLNNFNYNLLLINSSMTTPEPNYNYRLLTQPTNIKLRYLLGEVYFKQLNKLNELGLNTRLILAVEG